VIDWSEVGFNSGQNAIQRGSQFTIKGHIEYLDPNTASWRLIGAPMDTEVYVKVDGIEYKVGSGSSDKDSNGNPGTGYFIVTSMIGGDVPAGAGQLKVKVLANMLYAGSEIEETQMQGMPAKPKQESVLASKPKVKARTK